MGQASTAAIVLIITLLRQSTANVDAEGLVRLLAEERGKLDAVTTLELRPSEAISVLRTKPLQNEPDKDEPIVEDSTLKNLPRLRNLRRLDLSNSQISDASLKNVADLGRLEALSLRNTAITDSGLSRLKTLKNLRMLALSGTQSKGAFIRELDCHLEYLDLSNCSLKDGELTRLKGGGSLKTLKLSHVELTDAQFVDFCRAFPNLQELDVSGNSISLKTLRELRTLKSLERITLNDLRLGDEAIAVLATIPKLLEINLEGNGITGRSLGLLKELRALSILDLSDNIIRDEFMTRLVIGDQLRCLAISGNPTSEAAFREADLSQIMVLRIKRTLFTKEGSESLARRYPHMKIASDLPGKTRKESQNMLELLKSRSAPER